MRGLTREFYIPGNATKISSKTSDAVAYIYQNRVNSKPAAMVFVGRQQKPVWQFYFGNEVIRAEKIAKFFKNQKEIKESKAKRREELKAPHDFKVGDILYTSWGYSMTFVNFYQILELKGKATATVREISQLEMDEDAYMTGHCVGVKDNFAGDEFKIRVKKGGGKIDGHYSSKWDGGAKYWNRLD